jgi:hypothetical protein
MIDTVDGRVVELIKQVAAWLVSRNFLAIEARSAGSRLLADHMRQAIEEYGRTLIMPPDATFSTMDVIRVTNADRPTWSVCFDLWTKEEGRSDLSLECTVAEGASGGRLDLEVDDIHVR